MNRTLSETAMTEAGKIRQRLDCSYDPNPKTIRDLIDEICRARTKFEGHHPDLDRFFVVLAEEVGELARAIQDNSNWREEALHVACVAIRIVEEGESSLLDGISNV